MRNHFTPSWETRDIFLFSPRSPKDAELVFMEITNKYQALWLLSESDRKERDLFYSRGLNSVPMPRDLEETQHPRAA